MTSQCTTYQMVDPPARGVPVPRYFTPQVRVSGITQDAGFDWKLNNCHLDMQSIATSIAPLLPEDPNQLPSLFQYAPVAGEVGVLNAEYQIGDVRRYGVFPDALTNWQVSFSLRIAAIFANSILPTVTIYWPAGVYNTGLNLTIAYSGSKMHFDNATFTNILHILGTSPSVRISNVRWTGSVTSYDRLGLFAAEDIVLPEYIAMRSDPLLNQQGTGNRGVHFLGCENLRWGLIDIYDTAPTQAALPGAQTTFSAFTIQSQGFKNFKGDVRIRDAAGHGAYINALDLDINLRVEGYGKSLIDLGTALEGSDSELQSQQGCGVWFNRCTGRVGLHVEQKNATPLSDVYAVLVDETGVSSVPESRQKPLEIYSLYATVGNDNRGVCVGEALAPSVNCNVVFSGMVDIRLRAATTLAASYAGFNVLPPSTAVGSVRRVKSALPLSFHNFGTQQEFKASSAAGLGVFTELDLAGLETNLMAAGRFAQFDGTGGVLRGRVGSLRANYVAGSSTVPVLDVDSCENFHIENGSLRSNSPVTTRAVRYTNNTDSSIKIADIFNFGRGGEGAVTIESNTRSIIGPMRLNRDTLAQEGVRFNGTNTDCRFQGISVANMATGYESGAAMTFVRCSASDCSASDNTVNTVLTIVDVPLTKQFNCTNLTI